MKLLGTDTSPYVRKVRLVLLEKNIAHTYLVDPPREPGSMVARVNPLGRIPALILDDETCVFDSPVIAEYLDTLNDTPVLIPRNDALARMRVRRWEALADGIMDSAVAVRNECVRSEEKQEPTNISLHNNAVTRALAHAAELLGEREWCEGSALSLADLALASALVYLNLRQPERDWRGAHPNLAAWFERMAARPSVRATLSAQP
ncbi:glutathione S-transferase [Ferrigenium kumadai]|uniref:Glutathione S-transferase n=1 Tax=Ferrigenium kumadai TaxID=1682490 RepID=A0AAN1T102_9PROT|nr:glutathione S-transferase N-terminal domain-containing protein [Ferrigenium kumadai]BBI99885.1 glutathione S-transferase [Ferrigenium kumadai]